jgi:hypothetical protein
VPTQLAITHFGLGGEPAAQLRELRSRLLAWAELARDGDRERFLAVAREELVGADAAEQIAAYGTDDRLLDYFTGLARYWSRRNGD